MLSPRPRLSKLSDLDLMGRLQDLSYLSAMQVTEIHERMSTRIFKRGDVIFREEGSRSPDTHLLLLGTAELRFINSQASRVVAIVPPGLILNVPLMPGEVGHCFELKALNDCRAGRLPTTEFMSITLGANPDLYSKMSDAENGRLGRLMARYPNFIGLNVFSRTVVALMELVLDFGVRDDRGMLLRISPTHQQLADLIGASRSKVTRMLAELERRQIIVRQGRQIAMDVASARAFLRGGLNGRSVRSNGTSVLGGTIFRPRPPSHAES